MCGRAEQLDLLADGSLDGPRRREPAACGGQKPLPSRSLPASMYLRVASAKLSWHSVLTLILETPREMAFLIISSGMPVPPCRTRGMLSVALWILSSATKSRPFQLGGGTCHGMLPMPAARKSMPRAAILAHSAGSSDLAHADDAVLLAADGADLGFQWTDRGHGPGRPARWSWRRSRRWSSGCHRT